MGMLRSAASKVMWVGRATVFLVGLAVILALLFGVASTALAHKADRGLFHLGHSNAGKALSTLVGTLTTPVLKVDNNGTGPALQLEAGADRLPLTANAEAGTATNLSADELDGKDSAEILPFARAQKDKEPTSSTEPASCCPTVNTVSIAAPTDGFFVISGSTEFSNHSLSDQGFALWAAIDDRWVGGRG